MPEWRPLSNRSMDVLHQQNLVLAKAPRAARRWPLCFLSPCRAGTRSGRLRVSMTRERAFQAQADEKQGLIPCSNPARDTLRDAGQDLNHSPEMSFFRSLYSSRSISPRA